MEATQACSLTNGIVGRSGACLGLGARAEAGLRGTAGSRHRCVQCGKEPEREWGGGATDKCVFVCTVDFAVMCCVLSVGAVKYAVRRSGARCGAAVCLAALGREQC